MNLRAKIELERPHLENPEANGVPRDRRIGLDMDIIADDGHELQSDEVIEEGYAYESYFGFEHESGEKFYFRGKGASDERFPEGHEAEGKAVPNPGYELNGPGISAIHHSNGLRLVQNFKKLPEGYYKGFGEVKGVGRAKFIGGGNSFRIGKAKPRPRHGAKGKATKRKK